MPKKETDKHHRYCKGCYADVTESMYCHCGDFNLLESETYSQEEMNAIEDGHEKQIDEKRRTKWIMHPGYKGMMPHDFGEQLDAIIEKHKSFNELAIIVPGEWLMPMHWIEETDDRINLSAFFLYKNILIIFDDNIESPRAGTVKMLPLPG